MKKLKFSFVNFLAAIVLSAFVGMIAMAIGDYCGANNLPIVGQVAALVNFGLCLLPTGHVTGLAYMAVTREIWEDHIEGNLFKNNEFLLNSTDESQYVLQGKVVHIPQAGGLPAITVNNAFGPAAVIQRTDTDITYQLDVYSTPPIGITQAEQVEVSYDKMSSVMGEHEDTLNQVIADYILQTKWAPVNNILRTSGIPNNDATQAPVAVPAWTTGATGNRLKFGLYDLKAIQTKMDKANIPSNDRYAVLSVDMYGQLVDDLVLSKYREPSLLFDQEEGVIRGKLFGFKITKRSSAIMYDNTAGTPVAKAYGAASAADDNEAGLFWQKAGVGRAKGTTKFFSKVDDPIYQADIYSFSQRMGGRIRRANEENVIAMVAAAAPAQGA